MADDLKMPLTAHLEELRWRIIKSLAAIGIVFIPCYVFANYLFYFLAHPLFQTNPGAPSLIGTGIAEAFFTKLKISFIAGIFGASPAVLYQVWQFAAPGLYKSEKRYVFPFILFGSLFFIAGAGFCYAVVLPVAYAFFLEQFADIGVQPALRISEYLTFTSRLLLAFGITFEMPVLAFFFARTGLLGYKMLVRFGRYAILVIFIVAAVLTPGPDVTSQLLLAGPLLLLYGVSIGVAYVFGKEKA